jgi:hypothetical protein
MIKDVDLLRIDTHSNWDVAELVIVITIIPLIFIFTSTLSSNLTNLLFILSTIIAIIIQLQFTLKNQKTINTIYAYIFVLILSVMDIIFCIKITPYSHDININYFKVIIFIFSFIYFLLNANTFLSELKKILFSKFIIENEIQLYTPKDNPNKGIFNNYWSPIDPSEIKFLDSNNNLIKETKNTYITIRRSPAYYRENAFQPIYDLIVCQLLLRNSNDRQKYFNTIYISLVAINFIYFLASLFMTKVLMDLKIPNEFIYLFIVSIIIINLSTTIYLFIKHLKIYRCDKTNILSRLQNNISIKDNFSIDKHYLTLNKGIKFLHNKEINALEDTNKKLIDKLDSIYQIATPILFLAQITISIALINYFIE